MRKLPINATDDEIITADGTTLNLDNQKNGWKGVCVFQEHDGDEEFIPVQALGRRCISICNQTRNRKPFLSNFLVDGKRKDVTANKISSVLKFAAGAMDYTSLKSIPIERVDNNYLRAGGANALSLVGYSYWYMQNMGRWRGETFK